MKKIKINKFLIAIFLISIAVFVSNTKALAQETTPDYPTVIDKEAGINIEDPSMDDIVILGLSIARFLTGLAGGVTIAMLCYGGFMLIASYMDGSEDGVGSAKTTIFNAVVGLIVILTSYLIVTMFQSALSSKSFG